MEQERKHEQKMNMLMNQSISSVVEDQDFQVMVPSVRQLTEKQSDSAAQSEAANEDAGAASSVSSWFGGYVPKLPSMLTGSAPKTYTAYHVVSIFDKQSDRPKQFEVDRRFSDFEKLLAHLQKSPEQLILPDLPKKRFFNSSEQVIELRRTELEKFLKTLLRSPELREESAVKYFLTQQEGFEVFLGNVGRYDWAHRALSSIDPKYFSIDMLKAVAQTEYESRGAQGGMVEPDHLAIRIPNFESRSDFMTDLDERESILKQMRDQFSAQAKISEAESAQINQIGLSLQALSSLDFNDTFQVVLNSKDRKELRLSDNDSPLQLKDASGGAAGAEDSESSGTGSTEYEVIQAAGGQNPELKLLKSESGSSNIKQSHQASAENSSSIRELYQTFSQGHFAQMKSSDLRAKALLSALLAELTGLKKAFVNRQKLLQGYKATQIVIDIKRRKQVMLPGDANQQAQIETEIAELQNSLNEKEQEIMKLNERLLHQISEYYESAWTDTMHQVASSYAATKAGFYSEMLTQFESCILKA